MSADFIPDSQFVPDKPTQVAGNSNASVGSDFIPDSQFQSDDDKYGTFGQQLKTGLESAASAATFGLSKGAERLAGVDPQDIANRERVNPGSAFLGSTAGLIGSAAIPGVGAANLLEHAGVAGAGALGLGAAEAGLASKIGAGAVKAGIEGALFQGGNEVGKMLISDPDQTVGNAAANIGLAGLIGGGVGGALGGTKELWNAKFGSKVAQSLENAQSAISGEQPQISPSPSADVELNGNKKNIGDLNESANRLGINLTHGTISDDPLIQKAEGNLAERPTLAGVAIQKERAQVFDGLQKASQEILRDGTDMSEAQVGKQIKEGIAEKLDQELKPIEAQYKTLEPHFRSIDVPDELKDDAINQIKSHDFVKQGPEYAKLADSLSDRINNIENVNDLKTTRTLVNAELSEAYRSGSPKARILQTAKDALTDMRESAIQNASNETAAPGEAIGEGQGVINDIRDADSKYRSYKQKLQQFGVEAGLGNVNDARSMLQRFSKLSDESFAKKIFDLNDINQLKFFKENFPEQFDLARRFKLGEIAEKSISEAQGKNSRFEVGSFLKQVSDKKLNPEARELLFDGKNLEKLQDVQNIYRAIPGAQNTSATSYAEAFGKFLNPISAGIDNITDAAQLAFLKAQPHLLKAMDAAGGGEAAALGALKAASSTAPADAGAFKSMVDYIANTIKGNNLVGKTVGNIFKEGETVLPSHLIPDDKSKNKLDKKLKDLQSNNAPLFDVGDQVGHYLPNHATALAQTSAQSVQYLNSLRPDLDKKSPLDSEVKPSTVQKAAFDNALAIAQQPLVVLKDIKHGNITSQDIKHMQAMYPALYSQLSNKIQQQMIQAVHDGKTIPYKTRIGLSVFLAQPMDSTMTPQGIMSAQPKAMNVAPQQQQTSNQSSKGAHSLKALQKLPESYATPQQAREASRLKS